MSSDLAYITSLTLGKTYLYRFGGPILMGIGSVSCILSLIVFTKKNLRKNPCSIYLIAFNISNFLIIYTSLLQTVLFNGYNVTFSSNNLDICRFTLYTSLLFDILSQFYLVLASIDRILVTSSNARIRHRSTHRLAFICIIIGTIFWILFHSHALIFSKIIEITPQYFVCTFDLGIYLVLIGYYTLILKIILIPLCMIILGLWAVKNIRKVRRVRVALVLTTIVRRNVFSSQSKDRQLIKILFMNISIYIIFNLMFSIVLMYQQITQYRNKSIVQIQIDFLLLNVSFFGSYIPYCIGCYTNLIVSKTFRNEIKNILFCK